MKLPNGHRATVDLRKLTEYCLNLNHPNGRHKARVFASAGIHLEDAGFMRDALLDAARNGEITSLEQGNYGAHYVLDFPLVRRLRALTVRSVWLIPTGEDVPRLISCYLL